MKQLLIILSLISSVSFAGAIPNGSIHFNDMIIVPASQFSESAMLRYLLWNGVVTRPVQHEFILIDGELATEQIQLSQLGGKDGCAIAMDPAGLPLKDFVLSGDYQVEQVHYNYEVIAVNGKRSTLTTVKLDISPRDSRSGKLRSVTLTRIDSPLKEGDYSPLKLCFGDRASATIP